MSEWLDRHSAEGYGTAYDASLGQGYWGAHWEHLEGPALRTALHQCRKEGAGVLLDVACGTGRVLSLAQSILPTAVGADASSAMLRRASQAGYGVIQCDAAALAVRKTIDVVTAFRFMLNASPDLRQDFLTSVRSVLVDRGWFISNIHVNANGMAGLAYRLYNSAQGGPRLNVLSLRQYTEVLRRGGFAPERIVWLGALPRLSRRFDALSARLLMPTEGIARQIRVTRQCSQSFMVIARPL